VEDRDEESKDGSEEEETHGVSVLLGGVVESLSTSVFVDLLSGQTKKTGGDTEDHKEDDGLNVSKASQRICGKLTYASIRPDLKILEYSKCRVTLGPLAAATLSAVVAGDPSAYSRLTGPFLAIVAD
jgi:hypothetical protein